MCNGSCGLEVQYVLGMGSCTNVPALPTMPDHHEDTVPGEESDDPMQFLMTVEKKTGRPDLVIIGSDSDGKPPLKIARLKP